VTDRRGASERASDVEAEKRASKRTFGERLRLARGKAGVSQSELSRNSGVPKTMLSRYENDHILPSVTTLKKLATALGESVSALVGNGPAVLHTFAAVLGHRGIVIGTEAEAEQLALVIATLVEGQDDRLTFLEIIEHRAELEA
jgi:transcriptional regulator with XRE-family HTH domain